MKFKYILFLSILALFAACGYDEVVLNPTDSDLVWLDSTLNLQETNNEAQLKLEKVSDKFQEELNETASLVENKGDIGTYNGAWFSVTVPSGFKVSTKAEEVIIDDYTFEETDEANFISEDGKVEFFVYSPQWGGDPNNYLEKWSGEETLSDKTEAEEVMPSNVHRWITYIAADGSYKRSIYSRKDESTHLVFGIKYANDSVYEKYSSDYEAFKKSLQQYAD